VDLLPKIKIEIIAHNDDVSKIMHSISLTAKTGDIGDGKIFVYPVEDAQRIRTGERGDKAI